MRQLGLIMNPDGTPATVELGLRPSSVSEGRVKAAFFLDAAKGTYVQTAKGKAVAEITKPGKMQLGGEFRLEDG